VIPIYATALAVGGTLLLASLVLGHHGIDHGHDFGHGPEIGHEADGSHGDNGDVALIASFLSVRFWTFALAFFGLTGVVLDRLVGVLDGRTNFVVATILGGLIGFTASYTFNRLRRASALSSVPTEMAYVGLEGEVLLDVTPEEPGRIRISAQGSLVDIPARTEGPPFAKGARALVVDVVNGVARVAAPRPKT
jgi:hypothetical protein